MSLPVDTDLRQAKSYLKTGKVAEAKALYEKVLLKFPKSKRASEGLRQVLAILNQESAPRLMPPQNRLEALVNLYRQKRFHETKLTAIGLIETFPNVALLHNILGLANAGLEKYDTAIACYRRALELNPVFFEAHTNIGVALKQKGNFDDAIDSFKKALTIKPDEVLVYRYIGLAQLEKEAFDQAIEALQTALRLKPDFPKLHSALAVAFLGKGDWKSAISSCQNALKTDPDNPNTLYNMGSAQHRLGWFKAAIDTYQIALAVAPDFVEAHNNLGLALQDKGDVDAAIKAYEKTLQIDEAYAEAQNNIGNALVEKGKFREAVASYRRAVQIRPDYCEAHSHLAHAQKYHAPEKHLQQMLDLYHRKDLSQSDRMHLSFALGKVHDDISDFAQAFNFFHEGNRLRKQMLGYHIETDRRLFSDLKNKFATRCDALSAPARAVKKSDKLPIFILGMPRSGTTLVEQIISSHSLVHGAGELPFLDQGLVHLNLVHSELSEANMMALQKFYSETLLGLDFSDPYVTDKMPLNFRWIGFILSAFPDAKIIHVNRDARATCWSIFKHYFSTTGNGYAHDLNDLAEYYKMYLDLMAFWHARYPGQLHDIQYENLVFNQENETRNLISYLGLEWQDQCLEFHKNSRPIKTASSMQVREKLYTGSSEKWRNYAPYLGDFEASLLKY